MAHLCGDALRPAEDAALRSGAGGDARLNRGVGFFIDPWHAEEEVRFDFSEVFSQRIERASNGGVETTVEAGKVFFAAKDMRQWQKEQVHHARAHGIQRQPV